MNARVTEFFKYGTFISLLMSLFLLNPRIDEVWAKSTCIKFHQPFGPFRIPFNCDSYLFLDLAKDPSLLFSSPGALWQSRPLYGVVGYIFAIPLQWTKMDVENPIYGALPQYLAFILLNLLLLTFAAMMFRRIIGARSGLTSWAILPMAMLVTNQISKAFFWTPHLQIFNIFIPVFTLYLCYRVQRCSHVSIVQHTALGLVLGTASLMYGAFVVSLGALVLTLLFAANHSLGSWSRRPTAVVGVILAAFIAPILVWVSYVTHRVGSFYSHEIVQYRQFVWMMDSIDGGLSHLMKTLSKNLDQFISTVSDVSVFPTLLLGFLLSLDGLRRHDQEDFARRQMVSRAILAFWAVAVPFYALMGYYTSRLTWALTVPSIVLISFKLEDQINSAVSNGQRTTLAALMVVSAVLFISYWVCATGPYG
jgi:hypothetical protein